MTDIAARIRECLDETSDRWISWTELACGARAMLDFADELSSNPTGNFFAIEIRDRIAKALCISDSPAVASGGSQPTQVTARAPTLTDGLIIAVGVELKSRVWEHGMPPISDAQLTELVEVVLRLVREDDAGDRGECA